MPLYEYECVVCAIPTPSGKSAPHRFEVLAKMSDPPPVCPQCGGAVTKCVSAASFELKGSGWYRYGYAT